MKTNAGILIVILLLAINSFAQYQNNSVLNIPVSVNASDITLTEALSEISRKANVYFSYDASIIVSDRLVSLNVNNQPVRDVLKSLFDTSMFSFIEKENQIIISFSEDTDPGDLNRILEPENKEYITLSGQLVDEKNNDPLLFASVSVFNKPIGTITNTEGKFILKIKHDLSSDPIVLSCVGYSQKILTVSELQKKEIIALHPVSILIKEVRVNAISPYEILDNVVARIDENYGNDLMMMKGFYRETLKQDEDYIKVSEAVIDILKSEYSNTSREDKIRIVKGRKSSDVSPFQWVNFKLMGGPTTMTQLDILKTMGNFIDPEYRNLYKYDIDRVIWFHNHPVFVLRFKPARNDLFLCYEGELYIDRETYAVLHVDFGFSKKGLRIAEQSLIKKRPKDFKVKPENVRYNVDYRYTNGICYLYSAKASIVFKVRHKIENINSKFFSVSELLVTDFKKSQIKRFPRKEVFNKTDIFAENIDSFDEDFWGSFNIFKPDEDLQGAIENLKNNYKSTGKLFLYDNNFLSKSESEK
ncbi:MAG: carboxypeptidase-like regulatory domain-containing protein [Prolixibacteraceae bacterium]|nr:carboxypeptidase-like regulatory domain-containing protein [Prolixibacteraceae bacterium]